MRLLIVDKCLVRNVHVEQAREHVDTMYIIMVTEASPLQAHSIARRPVLGTARKSAKQQL